MFDLKKYGDSVALVAEKEPPITYLDLYEAGEKLYKVIGRRCLVFCFCENTSGSVLGYVTFLNHGIVPVMLSSHLDDELLVKLINIYHPAYLWKPKSVFDSGKIRHENIVHEAYGYELINPNRDRKSVV